jgi:hypothetical protein
VRGPAAPDAAGRRGAAERNERNVENTTCAAFLRKGDLGHVPS